MAAAFCIVRELPAERILRLQNWAQNQGCRRPLAPGKRGLQGSRKGVSRARFGNSKADLDRAAFLPGFPASEQIFRPWERPTSPRFSPVGMNSRVRVRVVWKRFVSPPPDGESSVKSIWGTRTRLAASPSRDKILCRCSPTAVTAALQGTPWRGDTPRRGLSASSCSDWDGPHPLARSHHLHAPSR